MSEFICERTHCNQSFSMCWCAHISLTYIATFVLISYKPNPVSLLRTFLLKCYSHRDECILSEVNQFAWTVKEFLKYYIARFKLLGKRVFIVFSVKTEANILLERITENKIYVGGSSPHFHCIVNVHNFNDGASCPFLKFNSFLIFWLFS